MRLTQWAHALFDFCYPGRCAICEAACEGANPLCDECFEKLRELESAAACHRCAKPVAQSGSPCPYCMGEGVRPFERILRLGEFKDPLKRLIHQIKYHNRWSVAEYLAERLLAQSRVRMLLEEMDCLVAVPLHPLRQMSRGYNQAQLVARRLAGVMHRKLRRPIVRLRNTQTQTHLHSRQHRIENLREAFGPINLDSIRDRHIVVIDDVMTTGATLQSVARTLQKGEPASLCAIVLAVADPRQQDFTTI